MRVSGIWIHLTNLTKTSIEFTAYKNENKPHKINKHKMLKGLYLINSIIFS